MTQWILMAMLTAFAALAVLVPLARQRTGRHGSAASVAVYRDQLSELDRDRDRGLIGATEADAARLEISRRLLRASDSADSGNPPTSSLVRKLAAGVGLVCVPAAALVLYLSLGSPELPDQPLAARLADPSDDSIEALVARVEQHLAANPGDGRGWEVLAPAYLRVGRGNDAIRATETAMRLLGVTAEREADLGEMIVRVNGGDVTEPALAAFDRALKLEPGALRPRFYRALAMTQNDDAGAANAWRQLLADAPAGAAWVGAARTELARLEGRAPGPDQAAIDSAASLTPQERQAMIEGMVASLAARLKDEPRDPEGWVQLIRSYMVLGRADDARTALAEARAALAADAALVARFEGLVPMLGLTE